MTWKQKKDLENRKVVSLGGKVSISLYASASQINLQYRSHIKL